MKRSLFFLILGVALLLAVAWLGRKPDSAARQAGAAYHRGEYNLALEHLQQVDAKAVGPGWKAVNEAAALYRLERYGEAEEKYAEAEQNGRRLRSARAAHDCGNSLLQQACQSNGSEGASLLGDAVEQYRACLEQEPLASAGTLFDDARHNLELAKLLLGASAGQVAEQHCPT